MIWIFACYIAAVVAAVIAVVLYKVRQHRSKQQAEFEHRKKYGLNVVPTDGADKIQWALRWADSCDHRRAGG